jgi:phosphoserine phosphatase RsbU/P
MGEAAEFGIDSDAGPQRATGAGAGRWLRRPGPPQLRRGWHPGDLRLARTGSRIRLGVSGPAQPSPARAKRVFALLLWLAVTAVAVAVHYHAGRVLIPVTWLAVGPLLASLLLAPLATAALAGWVVLLGLGLMLDQPGHPEGFASRVSVLVLLAAFAVVNAVLRAAAQRRLSQVRAVARVAQSAVLREVPTTVTAGRLASRYISAAAEAQVGGDLLEVVSDGGRSRWLIGDTRGKGLPAVRLASIAMTSFRDACAQPGLGRL